MIHKNHLTQAQNLADFIEVSLTKYAKLPAYSCFGQTLTFSDIDKKSQALAAFHRDSINQSNPFGNLKNSAMYEGGDVELTSLDELNEGGRKKKQTSSGAISKLFGGNKDEVLQQ